MIWKQKRRLTGSESTDVMINSWRSKMIENSIPNAARFLNNNIHFWLKAKHNSHWAMRRADEFSDEYYDAYDMWRQSHCRVEDYRLMKKLLQIDLENLT